jgi:hypothetical protein
MMHVTTDQLLNVWMELEDALKGENTYDGHTAEIYRHTVQRQAYAFVAEAANDAEQSLRNIYKLFAEKREAVVKMVDHQGHRYHIKVTPSKGKGRVIIPMEFR